MVYMNHVFIELVTKNRRRVWNRVGRGDLLDAGERRTRARTATEPSAAGTVSDRPSPRPSSARYLPRYLQSSVFSAGMSGLPPTGTLLGLFKISFKQNQNVLKSDL